MIDLTNAKFGDKYKTRDGRIVILTKKYRHTRRIWFEGWYGYVDCDFADCEPNRHWWYKDGTAHENFEWLDLIEKIE